MKHLSLLPLGTALLASFLVARQDARDPLLGADPDVVLARFGVPDEVVASAASLTFVYATKAGEEAQRVEVVFHDDVAVRVPAPDFVPQTPVAPVANRIHKGQRVKDAVALLGNPASVSMSSIGMQLRYGQKSYAIAHGRILSD